MKAPEGFDPAEFARLSELADDWLTELPYNTGFDMRREYNHDGTIRGGYYWFFLLTMGQDAFRASAMFYAAEPLIAAVDARAADVAKCRILDDDIYCGMAMTAHGIAAGFLDQFARNLFQRTGHPLLDVPPGEIPPSLSESAASELVNANLERLCLFLSEQELSPDEEIGEMTARMGRERSMSLYALGQPIPAGRPRNRRGRPASVAIAARDKRICELAAENPGKGPSDLLLIAGADPVLWPINAPLTIDIVQNALKRRAGQKSR
jgi:hypothetical protein